MGPLTVPEGGWGGGGTDGDGAAGAPCLLLAVAQRVPVGLGSGVHGAQGVGQLRLAAPCALSAGGRDLLSLQQRSGQLLLSHSLGGRGEAKASEWPHAHRPCTTWHSAVCLRKSCLHVCPAPRPAPRGQGGAPSRSSCWTQSTGPMTACESEFQHFSKANIHKILKFQKGTAYAAFGPFLSRVP